MDAPGPDQSHHRFHTAFIKSIAPLNTVLIDSITVFTASTAVSIMANTAGKFSSIHANATRAASCIAAHPVFTAAIKIVTLAINSSISLLIVGPNIAMNTAAIVFPTLTMNPSRAPKAPRAPAINPFMCSKAFSHHDCISAGGYSASANCASSSASSSSNPASKSFSSCTFAFAASKSFLL